MGLRPEQIVVEDGEKVTMLAILWGSDGNRTKILKGIAVAGHFVWRPYQDIEGEVYPTVRGELRSETEGARWARGWGDDVEKALLAAFALEQSSAA